jgi:putative membrane-bound dehydrogenase-like protein
MTAQIILLASLVATAGPAQVEQPKVVDPRLSFELFAAEPDIVTPTGITIEPGGRVLVIESNTHFRPQGYKGPAADRIRAFQDTDGDGRAERVETVFEGTSMTMGLAIHPSGALYVATRSEVFRLKRAPDGSYGERTPIAKLETDGNYPHNGLSGFAFDFAGNVYFGLGENLGATYKLIGSDGTTLTGGGEGGNVYRCDPDGKKLARVATGFWNPFHLTIDAFGRLFAVDNDPDSRPPCRLLHVVYGGDYGYRFRNGRRGLHPFTAWNGELPGTLPMVAGTGEAPSGIVAYESDNLPDEFRGTLIVTSWGDHRIDRFRLRPRGASFRSVAEPIVTGGENFRPVGVALAPDGSLFLSDWVDKSYEVHGKGRVWHLRAKQPRLRSKPTDAASALEHADRGLREAAARELLSRGEPGLESLVKVLAESRDVRARALAFLAASEAANRVDYAFVLGSRDSAPEVRALAARVRSSTALLNARAAEVKAEALRHGPPALTQVQPWLNALEDPDPFLNLAAREGLRRSLSTAELLDLARPTPARAEPHSTAMGPPRRLGILLILRESADPRARALLPEFLTDPDPGVRFAAIQWVGEHRLTEFRKQVADSLATGPLTRDVFEATLATLELLDRGRPSLRGELSGEEFVVQLLKDDRSTPAIRSRALRYLRPDHPDLTLARLDALANSKDPALAVEAVRTLRESPLAGRSAILAKIAIDQAAPPQLRAEAVVGLAGDTESRRELLVSLATDGQTDASVREEALRSLRGAALSQGEARRIERLAQGNSATALRAARLLGQAGSKTQRPANDLAGWLKDLEGPADAEAGARVFFQPKGAGCYRCHAFDGRGATLAPDLMTTARTLTRERLVESILQPDKEVAPQFTSWLVARTDGTVATGILLREGPDGEQTYANNKGETFTVKPSELAERRAGTASIMPSDLAQTMTLQEFRDLLAFLRPAP